MMTTEHPQTQTPNYVHDELALKLQQLVRLRQQRRHSDFEFRRQIADTKNQIADLAFSSIPGLPDGSDYTGGDPVSFFVGAHQVTLYADDSDTDEGGPAVEIERGHVLETSVDPFAEVAGS